MALNLRSFNSNPIDLNDKSILITGGTGSFGKDFIRAVLRLYKPRRLIIFSRDELKQYEMSQEFNLQNAPCIRYFIGDVRDANRLEMAMRDVDYVIHAAALKHVPAAEYNPFECIHTNVLGAENVVNAAIRSDVKRVLALSTDKACNPANLYGASKLASDKIFSAANNLTGYSDTSFSVVRYGNVVGSRGSVIPFFQKLIEEGKTTLPITDPRMTRFWITLEQSVNFVMSCMGMMVGGEIFIPKIPSMNMVDLAHALAPDLGQDIIGIRPGEKLHEVMITSDDARSTLDLGDRYIIEPTLYNWSNQPYMDAGAQRVEADFSYASNTNTEWLNEAMLLDMLANYKDG
ncbi:MAG: UDP-N-acetylglucosamine 4,6-dehydratase (inverting) [Rhodospirillales bacterium]|nr:UDP-N-acetylglucosamine 4,6-dehydratase (inverting) [Rhodospirillales bacterium]